MATGVPGARIGTAVAVVENSPTRANAPPESEAVPLLANRFGVARSGIPAQPRRATYLTACHVSLLSRGVRPHDRTTGERARRAGLINFEWRSPFGLSRQGREARAFTMPWSTRAIGIRVATRATKLIPARRTRAAS